MFWNKMKENWISKLIKLLNEYDDWMVSWYEEYFSTEWLFVTNAGQWFREEFILSKRYWFIQRLVENDKIDKQKFREKAKFLILSNTIKYYEFLLMELSIKKKPIQFLISIFK